MEGIAAYLSELFAAGASALAGLGGAVFGNHRRSKKNERQLEGDPGDPNTEGVLTIAKETREKVDRIDRQFDEFREETRRDHGEVMDRIEDLADDE